jgi:hypothetical protein
VALTLPPRLSVEEIVRYGSDNELAAFLGDSSGCDFTCLRCEWHEISPYAQLTSMCPVLRLVCLGQLNLIDPPSFDWADSNIIDQAVLHVTISYIRFTLMVNYLHLFVSSVS